MKAQFLKVNLFPATSFSVRHDTVPYINNSLHFHAEVELIHIKEGGGIQYIGDNIKEFHSGDLLLIGSKLPHFWSFDDSYFDDKGKKPDVNVIHFKENFWGEQFLELPENKPLKTLLETAKQGLIIEGKTKKIVARRMEQLLSSDGSKKLLILLETLDIIAKNNEYKKLSTLDFGRSITLTDDNRIDSVLNYSLANLNKKITIEEIAKVACLSPHSFCRFFKSKTRKTYSRFLIELRISTACKLLAENKNNVKQICYECGFNNPVSFYRYFKLITKKTPTQYQSILLGR